MASSLRDLKDFLDREFGAIEELAEGAERRSRVTIDEAPQISAAPGLGSEPDSPLEYTDIQRVDPDNFFGEDTARLFGAGILDIAESGTGIPEYAARQTGFDAGIDFLQDVRGGVDEIREGILRGVTPEYLDHVGREILTLDPDRTIWKGSPLDVAGAIWGKFVRALPGTLAIMLPAAAMFRAMNTAGALTYLGASEGGLSLGAIQNNLADEVNAMDLETLLKDSQRFADIYAATGDEELSRRQLIAEAQGAAPVLAGVGVAAISMTTGRLLKPVFQKATPDAPGLGIGARAGLGFAEEFPQEGSQGMLEQVTENVAAKIYDAHRRAGEGVLEAGAQEGFIGGLTGAGVSTAFGTRPLPPLPPPEVGPEGQLGLPGIGPAQPVTPEEEPAEAPEGAFVPGTGMGLQTEIFPDPGTTEAALPPPDVGRTLPGTEEEVMGPTGEQVTLPLGIAGTVPLAERGPDHRTLRPDEIPPLPDALDQPTAEPQVDLQAQIDDMKSGKRSGVYLSPAQVRTERLNIPKGAVIIPNFDGKGGRLIAKNEEAARHARERRAEGGSMQAIIGELTLSGVGKPSVRAGHVVQLLNEEGAVARESVVATKAEANKLRAQWKADGEVRIVSDEEALARRADIIEREEAREGLRTEDPALVAEATGDLLAPQPQPLTAAETRTTTEGFTVTLLDENNEVIEEETYETQEEADARADELAADFPDANVTVTPTRARAEPTKPGVTTTQQISQRELKGPPEGAPKGIPAAPRKEEAVAKPKREQYVVTGERTLKGKKKPIAEVFDTREEAEARQKELKKALGKAGRVDKEIKVRKTGKPLPPSTYPADVSKKPTGVDIFEDVEPTEEVQPTEEEEAEAAAGAGVIDEFDETMSTKEIEALPEFDVEFSVIEEGPVQPNKTIPIIERRETQTYKTRAAAKAAGTRAYNAAVKKAGEDFGVKESRVTAHTTPELDAVFLSAAQARADREQGTTTREFLAKNKTVSQKIQFIRREKAAQIRRGKDVKALRKKAEPTRVDKGGQPVKTDVGPLAHEPVPGAETKAQKLKREAAVKEANTRLGFAVTRAKKFLDRFDNLGPFGTYLSDETNLNGSLTKKGIKFAKAREGLFQLVELADAILTSGNKSNAHATLAKQVAVSLERVKIKGMNPQQFANEFSVVIEAVEKDITRLTKQSKDARTKNIGKLNRERVNAAKNRADREDTWGKDKFFNEIVGPVFRKFTEVIMSNVPVAQAPKAAAPRTGAPRYYKPDLFEITNLQVALRTYRKMNEAYPKAQWYTPIRAQLEYYGFRFDEVGDLIVEEFSPSNNLLGPAFLAKHGTSAKAAEEAGRVAVPMVAVQVPSGLEGTTYKFVFESAKGELPTTVATPVARKETAETADELKAARNIRTVNALIEKLKKEVASAKVTINGIKRQEQRFIRGLRKLGVWTDVSPGMGRISIGGYKSKTYRLVGPRLDARTMQKPAAKNVISRLATIPMPRELAPVAKRMTELDTTVEEFVDENAMDLFLEVIDIQKTGGALDTAASRIGDMIVDKYSQASANDVLDIIIDSLPEGHFYRVLAERLRSLGMTNITVQYDWAGVKFKKKSTAYGVYATDEGRIYLNWDKIKEADSMARGAEVIQTVMHEMVHGATAYSVRADHNLGWFMANLRDAARKQWIDRYGEDDITYGLRLTKPDGSQMPIDEFIAEVFSNQELQMHMRTTDLKVNRAGELGYERTVGRQTVWTKILDLIYELLGLEIPSDTARFRLDSLFDVFMLAEPKLFEHAGRVVETRELLKYDTYDTPLRNFAKTFFDRFLQSNEIIRRVREGGAGVIFNLTSMQQFAERFSKNPVIGPYISRYYDAFRKRNAKAAEYLETPQKLSHTWSELEASNPEEALAVSQVSTQASLLTIDPRVPITDDANKHLSDELKDVHADLHARWLDMSKTAKDLTNDVLSWYNESIETETLFLMQSALRGMLTGKEGSALEQAAFEKKFSIENLKKLQTRKDLDEALSEFFEKEGRAELLDTIYKMSMLPRKRRGIYVPLMRYGDEVSSAELKHEDKIFEDHDKAMAARAEIAADDPTISASVFENDEGKHVLRVVERIFIMGETVSEVEQMKQQMIDDPTNDFTEDDFSVVQKRISKNTDDAIRSNEALKSILNSLSGDKAAQAAIKNFYLRNLSEKAHRTHEIRRRNRQGVRFDLQHRNLATYAKQAAYYTAQLEFGWRMAKEIREAREVVKDTRDTSGREASLALEHLFERDKLSHDLPDRSTLTKKSIEATHFFMLASPSYWAINATQPWMVTLPTIGARHGWMESAATMWKFQKVIFGDLAREAAEMKGGLSALSKGKRARVEETFNVIGQIEKRLQDHFGADAQPYIALLEYLRQNHIIDINVFTEMRDVAAGKKQTAWDRTIDASRIMAHLTEVNNRVVSALAAYELEQNKSGAAAAVEYAGDIVSNTQFNYSAENKPPLFQKYPLLFQFMQWPQHMYAHLIRNYMGMVEAGVMNKSEARSALLGLLGTHAAVGGVIGMMLQPIKFAIGLTMMAFGDDDEPYTFANALSGRTFDNLTSELAAAAFGTTAGAVAAKGLPYGLLGADLSARMSMGTVYFVDLRGDNAESVLGSLFASFGGATLNQGLKFVTGAQKIMDGQPYRGVETMAPKIVRDAMRAGRYYNEGLVNNAGDTIIEADEMSIRDVVYQAFGFQPSRVSKQYAAQQAIKGAEQYALDRRTKLMRRYRDAETSSDRRDIWKEIRDFNRSFPQEKITQSQLLSNRRASRKREQRIRRYGANISERKARYYERYAAPYRDE